MTTAEALKQWSTCAKAAAQGNSYFREDNDQPLERMLRRFPECTVEEVAKNICGYAAIVQVNPPKPKDEGGRQHKPFLLFVS